MGNEIYVGGYKLVDNGDGVFNPGIANSGDNFVNVNTGQTVYMDDPGVKDLMKKLGIETFNGIQIKYFKNYVNVLEQGLKDLKNCGPNGTCKNVFDEIASAAKDAGIPASISSPLLTLAIEIGKCPCTHILFEFAREYAWNDQFELMQKALELYFEQHKKFCSSDGSNWQVDRIIVIGKTNHEVSKLEAVKDKTREIYIQMFNAYISGAKGLEQIARKNFYIEDINDTENLLKGAEETARKGSLTDDFTTKVSQIRHKYYLDRAKYYMSEVSVQKFTKCLQTNNPFCNPSEDIENAKKNIMATIPGTNTYVLSDKERKHFMNKIERTEKYWNSIKDKVYSLPEKRKCTPEEIKKPDGNSKKKFILLPFNNL